MWWAAALAAAAVESGGALRLPDAHDFGRIPNNRVVSARLEARNAGREALEVRSVSASCGCVTTNFEPRSLAPGSRAALDLSWDPRGKLGPNAKTLRIAYVSAGRECELVVRISGDVLFAGKSGTLFEGDCYRCHGAPATGRRGAALYDAACAMCHGREREGVPPSPPLAPEAMRSVAPRALFDSIYDGAWERGMPAFGLSAGGPLDAAQVASVAKFLQAAPRGASTTARPAP